MKNFLPKPSSISCATKLMCKSAFSLIVAYFMLAFNAQAQTSTELFETESHGSSSFTDNGVIFNIISNVNTYDIQGNYPGKGWSGSANDNRYIDNSGADNQSTGSSFSIRTTSNLFKVNRFWIYAGAANLAQNVTGTLTITGKLSGVTKFSQTKSTGFATSLGATNGFTLIDLTNLNGQNYSNIIIDQLQITAGGNYVYLGFDAFTWVKDSNLVLPIDLTAFSASLSKAGILSANWETASETNNSHFIVQASNDGKTWNDVARKEAVANAKNGASYSIAVNFATVSLSGFGLLGLLFLPFCNRRYRLATIIGAMAILGISCAKDNDIKIDSFKPNTAQSGTIYVRLAQVDLDGTTTYSNPVAVSVQ